MCSKMGDHSVLDTLLLTHDLTDMDYLQCNIGLSQHTTYIAFTRA